MAKELVLAIRPPETLRTTQISHQNLQDMVSNDTAYFLPRAVAEEDESFVHLIPYVILCNENGEVLVYQRSKAGSEKRLEGKFSIGVGGHINPSDMNPGDPSSAILNAARREIEEEFNIKNVKLLDSVMTLIYDPSDAVGRVHLGVLVQAQIRPTDDLQANEEIARHEWVTVDELKAEGAYNLENWSRIALDYLR